MDCQNTYCPYFTRLNSSNCDTFIGNVNKSVCSMFQEVDPKKYKNLYEAQKEGAALLHAKVLSLNKQVESLAKELGKAKTELDKVGHHEFYVLWSEKNGNPTYKHVSHTEARHEAERLARQNPGTVFNLLGKLDAVKSGDLAWESWPNDNDIPF